jgi:signal transduction histidine kinase
VARQTGIALLPWLARRLPRVDRTSLRTRLTLALIAVASVPLEQRVIERTTELEGTIQALYEEMGKRAELEEDLHRRYQELQEQGALAREASRLKSEFLANMSHELRTPLNAIIGFCELIHDGKVGPISELQQEYLGDVLTSARHLLDMISDVLDLAKIEAGKLAFRPEPTDVALVTREVGDALGALAATKRIRLTTEIDPALGPVEVDPARLKQVLYNYLSNALKFTPDGGCVAIRARPEGADAFRLEVEDTGIGIRPEDQRRLFVEFQQLDAGLAKAHPGTGLGLALTRRIVEAQSGQVGVRSAPGQGSTFFAVLPRAWHAASH